MKPFQLFRRKDETGMSGEGVVAYGAKLPHGQCVMIWAKPPHSIGVYPSISELEELHAHGRNTTEVQYTEHLHPMVSQLSATLMAVSEHLHGELINWKRG